MGIPDKAKELHNQLMTELHEYVNKDIDHNDYEKVKNLLKTKLSPLALKISGDKHIMDMIDKLEKRGLVRPGNYDTLKNIFDGIDVRWSEMISDREQEIQMIIQEAENTGAKRPLPAHETKTQTPLKRQRTDNTDGSKPEYEIKENQTGLLLLFNFNKNREGSERDVEKIDNFFKSLDFDVRKHEDLSEQDMKSKLEGKQDLLNLEEEANRYYCLFVIVMAHGDKDGIRTGDDKTFPLESIIKYFRNDKIPKFAGKPRVFIVQSCRGDEAQKTVDVADEWPDIPDVMGKMSVPYDSDVLTAYATTPGYQAFRREGYGAWFIGSMINVFQENYLKEHLEEMLIDVKNKVVSEFQTNLRRKQMPCTVSTLRKRLYLSRI